MSDRESHSPLVELLNTSVPFARHTGVVIADADADSATALLPEAPHLLNHVGSQHAGALFTLGEAASGAAMTAVFADLMGSVTPLVRQATIRYLKVARGEIAATARLTAPAADVRTVLSDTGKANFDIEVTLRDVAGTDVAMMDVEWSLRRRGE